MVRLFASLTFLIALPFAVSAVSPAFATTPDDLVFRRAATLQKGINLSGWFASTTDFSQQHAETYITPADLRLIHDAGFGYIRVGVDPAPLLQHGWNSAETNALLSRIDLGVNEALQAGLAVDVCVFPGDDYKHELETQKGVDDFVMLWQILAQHFVARDPNRVFLELMNEPEVSDSYRWIGIQATTISAIRKVDGARTIIATAAQYSGLGDLLKLQPVVDRNVVYNFHFYEPYPFTHQGASWGSSEWNYFHRVPYPATPETLRSALADVQDDYARYSLYLYGASGWNQQSLLGRLQFARDWGTEHHVPVICNEFGAYRDTAPPDSRARYIKDVRTNLERLQIGWAMWDYRGDFGMVVRQGAISVAEPAVVDALGLHIER